MNPAPVESRFDTYQGYRQAVAEVVGLAEGRIVLFDPDLGETGLESPLAAAALTRFFGGRRDARLQIVLHRTGHVERHCPRLLALLRLRSHVFDIRRTPDDLRQLTDCFVLADARHGAIRFHADHPRGKLLLHHDQEIGDWQRRFDELWELSSPALAATTLGL
jgi:hypothetical protein